LQSTERRRKLFSAQCPAALNQRQTIAIGQTREKSKIEFPILLYRIQIVDGECNIRSGRLRLLGVARASNVKAD